MNIENIREVKTRFSRYIKDLSKTGSVMITKNGRPCAALVPVTEDTDLEALALSQNKRFWNLIDNAIARSKKEGFIDFIRLAMSACGQVRQSGSQRAILWLFGGIRDLFLATKLAEPNLYKKLRLLP
jgi:prevent-host-death family protein